jgi:hypothetical protein
MHTTSSPFLRLAKDESDLAVAILPGFIGKGGDFRSAFLMFVASFDLHEGVAPTALGDLLCLCSQPLRGWANFWRASGAFEKLTREMLV